jgi:H+/Cl- antiporter ClcA
MSLPPAADADTHRERTGARRIALWPATLDLWHRGAAWIAGPLLIGLAAVALASGCEYAGRMNRRLLDAEPLAAFIILPAAFALLAYLCRRFAPGTHGSGIPQTIAALETAVVLKNNRLLSLRIAIGKAFLTLGAVAAGASAGREGPMVQIGASIMHAFYGRGPFQGASQRRVFILAGGAAGIAAAFNTPLAGIMFAIEELSKKHVFNANSPTLITVILSGLISLSLLGNYTYFGYTGVTLDWQSGIVAILVCGVVGGAAGGLFSRLFLAATFNMPAPVAQVARQRPIVFAAWCGLALAVLGFCTGNAVFGTGYDPTRLTLQEDVALPWYFGVTKMAATLLSSISGIAGGVFAPSLAAGAGIGDNLASLFPALAPHAAIILLVMAAYLAGVTRAPVTSFIIMMEMTDSHQMLLPLMTASVVAAGMSKLICPVSLYHGLAARFLPPPPARETVISEPVTPG